MKILYRIVLMIVHSIGLVFISAASFSRICFIATWPPKDDLILWLLIIVVLCVHYGLLLWGHKFKYLSLQILRSLKIIEMIYSGFQFVVIVFVWVVSFFNLSFYAVYPMIVTPVIVLGLRILTSHKIGDGLREPLGKEF